jgi:hypothetical protein
MAEVSAAPRASKKLRTGVFDSPSQARPAQSRKYDNVIGNAFPVKSLLYHREASSLPAHRSRAIDGGCSLADAIEGEVHRPTSCSNSRLDPVHRTIVEHLVGAERFEESVVPRRSCGENLEVDDRRGAGELNDKLSES